ncbi:MAG TPA: GNAT family N-acetyltransferase [Thermoplasmata archaeon]|nr:GNAT family N-acetyltransferase [Thermoplasmata archaeon]
MSEAPRETIEIRRLSEGESSEVLGAAPLFDEPPDPDAVRAYLANDRNVFFLARSGSLPVGFLRGTGLDQIHSGRRQMFLYEVFVDAAWRRQGIGRALIRALLEYCRTRKFEELFVFTDDPSNMAAHQLYRSTGGRTETVGERMYVYRL